MVRAAVVAAHTHNQVVVANAARELCVWAAATTAVSAEAATPP